MTVGEKVQYWGAIVVGIGAGVAAIVAAVMTKQIAYGIWGGVLILSTLVAVWSGSKASVSGSLESLLMIEAWFKKLRDGPVFIIMGLFVIGIILTFVFRPF